MDAIERYKDVIVIDSVEADTIKQIKYAIRKSKKILADNCYIGLALGGQEVVFVAILRSCYIPTFLKMMTSVVFTSVLAWEGLSSLTPLATTGFTSDMFLSSLRRDLS